MLYARFARLPNLLLRLDKVSLAFGSRPLLDGVSLQIAECERVCLVGRNGEGKSSLLKLVSRQIEPDDGEIWVKPDARLAFLAQDLEAVDDALVAEVVAGGLSSAARDRWELQHRIEAVMSRLGLDGTARFSALSGGWRRRVLLGRALVLEPQILLLDEPTNHLDIAAIEWLEEFMAEYRGALLFVSHDRAFVNRLATRVVDLDRGNLSSWPGGYDEYVRKKALQLENEAKESALFDKKLAQEEVWIRKGVEARRTRNEGRVRALYALRSERRARRDRVGRAEMQITAEKSAQVVFEAENAGFAYGAERPIIHGFSTRIQRGDRIGIVGANGAGKSTLIKLLLGELTASRGIVRRSPRLECAYYDQRREQLKLEASVAENVAGGNNYVQIGSEKRHVSGYLRDFLFRPEQLRTPASALSGGERNRLLLARLFARPANLLILDEPTNDLDINTLELLEELVANFQGTLLLVSHDRQFLDNVVTSLLVLDGHGGVSDFVGGWSDWASYRAAQERNAQERASPDRPTAATPKPGNKPRKQSFKEQRELDNLPQLIETLEAERAGIETMMQQPNFYSRPYTETQAHLSRFAQLAQEIERAYQRWEVLTARDQNIN
jgi:ATP-binding cassette subfamily F protein uup